MTGEILNKKLEDLRYDRRVDKKVVVEELSSVLNVSPRTVFKWIEKGTIKDKYHSLIENYFSSQEMVAVSEDGQTYAAHKDSVGENTTENMLGENTYTGSGKTSSNKEIKESLIDSTQPTSTQTPIDMEVPKEWEGVHTQVVEIPEFVDIYMFGIHILTVQVSTPIPGKRVRIDKTSDIIDLQTLPRKNSPTTEK